ncbi:hypothetical protein C2E31_08780 [Rhodopirellula baltica]|nr:hypothetical protein C2E31_27960 [Rhodopirellula baltica]PNY37245.1 hypothetical protein C2E31_08780 [Rhodopirellula baltica]
MCECHSDVARLCRLPIGVVEAYSTAFFDVSARSGASAWLASRVVRDSRFADDRLRMVLFQQALRGGPKVVEHWIEHLGFVDQGLVHDLSTPVGRERESLELIVLASRLGQPPTDNLFKASLEEVAANASLPIAVAGKLQAVCEAVLVDQVSDSLLQSVFSDCSDAASSAASMQEPRTADRSVRGHSKNVA